MGRLEIPLSREGRSQAKSVRKSISELRIDGVYSSPLKRAVETALILIEKRGFPLVIDKDLIELAFGEWEGYRLRDLTKDKTYFQFLEDPLQTMLPGGETLLDVQKRGLRTMRRARREYPNGTVLLMTHGDVIRAILCRYMKVPLNEFRRFRIDNLSLTALETDGDWAEIKFINYIPNMAQVISQQFEGLQPKKLKKR